MFSLNYHFLYWSPQGPLKVPYRSRTLRPLGDFQETSPRHRVPAGKVLTTLTEDTLDSSQTTETDYNFQILIRLNNLSREYINTEAAIYR